MFDIVCDQQLNEIVVSDRGSLGGLTQFLLRSVSTRPQSPNTNRIAEQYDLEEGFAINPRRPVRRTDTSRSGHLYPNTGGNPITTIAAHMA
jgi:hypothetical protein